MKDQEFKDKLVNERIAVLLGVKDIESREEELMKDNAAALEGLDQLTRQKIEVQMNLIINRMINSEQQVYVEGVKDGIKLMKWIQQF